MKRFIQLFCLFVCALPSLASAQVKVTLTDGIDNNVIKQKMENAISRVLTEANEAQQAGRQMRYSQLGIPADVQSSIAALWDNSPFVCMDEEIVEHCISTVNGYQVRNIPLLLKPVNPSDVAEDEDYQEAVVSFDKQGNITSFYLSISMNLYMNVVKANRDITDLRRRQLILDYVEQFRTSYNQKDINFLEAVFSDDALIITGKITKRKASDGIPLPDKIEYTKHTKVQYLNNLRKVFARNRYIRVTFDEIEVMRHPVNKDFYGVTLHQGWTSETYHDDGYLFLLWDFRDEQHPQIHVRTWQPDSYSKDGKTTQRISKDEIFSLSDFDI